MRTFLCLASLLAALIFTSCNSSSVIANKTYTLTELNGFRLKQMPEQRRAPQIKFTDKMASATVGCNLINAEYTTKGNGNITFGLGAMTKMYCPDALREDEFVQAFNNVARYQASPDGAHVNFLDKDGKILFRATIATPDPAE